MVAADTAGRLVFFGTEAYSVPTLEALLAAGYHVATVVTKPDAPAGRGRTLVAPEVKLAAERHGLPVLQPARLREVVAELAALHAEAGVLVAFGKIIPPAVLELFPRGIINIHPSLLPRYRGPAPIEAAILAGDQRTGVTLMQLDAGMDTGPLYAQITVELTGHESRAELYNHLFGLGTELLIQHLPAILGGQLLPQSQPASGASVTRLLTKADGQLDLSQPAAALERHIRAYLGWPGSHTTVARTDVTITAAHVASPTEATAPTQRQLLFPTSDGALIIDRLKPAGRRDMAAQEFLAGHQL
ncbi:MAG TPA: methionyl-tRNA formyltransferase [Candidatus Saccharimonadia bacterium]|nr:methionyl-tRNA formyltransferase [Candidatus Saccharimonadia bacterium]